MSWMTVIANALVPLASVMSSATVAIWTKRIDARNKAEDRLHERVLDFEKRAAEDKKAVLKSLISAIMYIKRAARYEGAGTADEIASQRRAEAVRELYDFRMRLGLDDGIAELLVYAAPPVRELVNLLLDQWDRQFRENGYSLTQLDSCKRQLATTACAAPGDDPTVYYEGELKYSELRRVEAGWLDKLGRDTDLELDALLDLCDRTLEAAHKDLRGGYGLEY